MIATYLDPPSGRLHSKLQMLLKAWISYFFVYTLRNRPAVLPTGDLEAEHAQVLRSLRPENQPFFDAFARDESCDTSKHLMRRKEILEKLGKYEEARRPLPLPAPGNPALRAKLREANRPNTPTNQTRPYSTTVCVWVHLASGYGRHSAFSGYDAVCFILL
ncbi:hypothetical protein LshimejAT787_1201910 [Lyophyllum shimeji]|uniref:Uncharacterized protein n=1 Tax=Lyophyllum shimeji TaxID=47721 RepID=A0A9P3PTT6_LYOSH|nr:hypothetical protein LshimejAT787_1201910 [Lyophyllum shimeji]